MAGTNFFLHRKAGASARLSIGKEGFDSPMEDHFRSVTQLDRVSPCHGEGCEFESRQSCHF